MTTPSLSIGSHIDFKDKLNTWCMGIVREIDQEKLSVFKIGYVGWEGNDHWIDVKKIKIE